MSDNENLSYFERRVLREIKDVESRIRALEGERAALGRQLAKAQSERTGLQEVTRKNSYNRVIAENSVVEALRSKKEAQSTSALYRRALQTNFDLKESTFRTYLHRMKKRGIIRTAKHVGTWEFIEK